MNRMVVTVVLSLVFVFMSFAQVSAMSDEVNCRVRAEPFFFGVASFLIPGLGQFMNGQDGKALVHLIVALGLPTAVLYVASVMATASPSQSAMLVVAAPIIYLAWGLYSALDAYDVSQKYCRS